MINFDARDYGYTIISRFEKMIRYYCCSVITSNSANFMELIPQGVINSAIDRESGIEHVEDLLEYIDFIHLKEIIIFKNNYDLFINKLILDKNQFIQIMDSLYQLRCKIAHIRNYFTNLDLTNLIEEVKDISKSLKVIDNEYLVFIETISSDPIKLVEKIPFSYFIDEKIGYSMLNNIPIADYEYEGGFVGREEDKDKITMMLRDGQHRVITLAGAGGVGKSALALSIVNEIIKKRIIEYDCVIWVSAKENRLTYLGIEDIEPTLQNYEELLDTILSVMGFDSEEHGTTEEKEADINLLFDSCDRALLVIDNLETITDERIINFILDSHKNTNILITSRRGLGQVERRYDLKELKEKEAIRLFRIICKEKSLSGLIKLDDLIIKQYVNKVYRYPLAIKWVLGQVAIGKNISDIIDKINETSSDISQFCFEQIYSELSTESKIILCTLSLYEDMVSKGIVKYISNLDEKIFEDSVYSLVLVSLILPEQRINKENQEINVMYSLLPLTRGYVKAQLGKDIGLKRQIQDRMITVDNILEEAERAKKQYRYSLSNLGAISEEEKVAAMLAQTGYQKYQAGAYLDAVESYKKAINIAPRFASIYRNWAIMESNEMHWIEADNLMDKASKLSSTDIQIWLAWGNIKRKNDKIKEAYTYYQKAYELSPNDNVVLNSLGQALSRMGEYEKADDYLIRALNIGGEIPNNRHLIINYTCIAENLRKWAESLVADRNPKEAEKKLIKAFDDMKMILELDNSDYKSTMLLREIILSLGHLKKNNNEYDDAMSYLNELIKMPTIKFKELEINVRASLEIVDIYMRQNKNEDAKNALNKELEKNVKKINKSKLSDRYLILKNRVAEFDNQKIGRIIRCNEERKFVIIENETCAGSTFLAFSNDFEERIILNDSLLNKLVIFNIVNENDKWYARNIKFHNN